MLEPPVSAMPPNVKLLLRLFLTINFPLIPPQENNYSAGVLY